MMYNQKLVASIKANGKVLREFKDKVYIPFGSEYSILLKNLNTVKALVNITIDGEDMLVGGLVLQPNQELDLERSIKSNNLNEGNKFKFIERTNSIDKHRGVKLQDGIVRIEYQFEKIYLKYEYPNTYIGTMPTPTYQPPYWYWSTSGWINSNLPPPTYGAPTGGSTLTSNTLTNTIGTKGSSLGGGTMTSCNAPVNNLGLTQAFYNDAGITVPGSHSSQQFSTASWFATEAEKHVIVLNLLGETPENKRVHKPFTVQHKVRCVTCHRQNKAHAKFCVECGTALKIYA